AAFRRAWREGFGRCPSALAEDSQRRRRRRYSSPARAIQVVRFEWCASLLASRGPSVVRRRRQDWRPVRGCLFFLYFELRGQNRRRSGGNGNGARLRAAIPVENFRGVAGGHDLGERRERRSNDVNST